MSSDAGQPGLAYVPFGSGPGAAAGDIRARRNVRPSPDICERPGASFDPVRSRLLTDRLRHMADGSRRRRVFPGTWPQRGEHISRRGFGTLVPR